MHAGGRVPSPRLAAANHVPEFARVAADRAPGLVGSAMGPDGALRKKQHSGLITRLFAKAFLRIVWIILILVLTPDSITRDSPPFRPIS
jgi:hypothetical protein